jgi:NADH-quinone oxidoreductase subunit M
MGIAMILSAAYMLRFIQKVIFGTPAREYVEGPRASALEGFAYGVMLLLLLAFGFHPAFVTNALHMDDDVVEHADVIEEDEGAVEDVVFGTLPSEEIAEGETEPLGSHIATSADVAKLDSSLTAAGFSEEEKKELIRQVIETEASMARATAAEAERRANESASANEAESVPATNEKEASND